MPYTFRKNGVFYFRRAVPLDLIAHHRTPRIAFSLRTRSRLEAQRLALDVARKLDDHWRLLRGDYEDTLARYLKPVPGHGPKNPPKPAPISQPTTTPHQTFSDAVELYLRLKGEGRPQTFHTAAQRACDYLTEHVGSKPLADYTRSDATAFRDQLFARGMAASSVTRTFTTVKAVYNFACAEWGLELKNPFANVYFDRTKGVSKRLPISVDNIWKVQAECRRMDDDLRWIVAMVSDTGARLAEIVGLAVDDIELDHPDGPVMHIREHPWRSLKTRGSSRTVPLVGASLWAARRAVEAAEGPYLFPRYVQEGTCNANSASAALSKWLKAVVTEHATMHSFRHSMRDRLRAAECPTDIVDQIGGWVAGSVGEGYGRGYPAAVLQKWLTVVEL